MGGDAVWPQGRLKSGHSPSRSGKLAHLRSVMAIDAPVKRSKVEDWLVFSDLDMAMYDRG